MTEFLTPEHWQMWATFAVIAVAIFFYTSNRISLELTSLLITGGLMVLFEIFPLVRTDGSNALSSVTLLAGFASPALVSILALLVIGQALFHSGALDKPTRIIARIGKKKPWLTIIATFLLIAVVSAFMNNTPVAVMFIPVLSTLAARLEQSPSKVMMPLSFVCILGGMTTLIGSSTNLLAAEIAASTGTGKIGFFDFTVPALVLAGVGFVYVLLVVPRLLPDRDAMDGETTAGVGKQYIAQIQVNYGHPLVGARSISGLFPPLRDMTVRVVQRNRVALLPPFEDVTLQLGDTVIVAATRRTLTEALRSDSGLFQNMLEEHHQNDTMNSDKTGDSTKPDGNLTMVEAVVAPGSRMIGRNLEQLGFRYETGCAVLGIQRRSRMIRTRMNDIRLEDGDVLLILGRPENIEGLRLNRDVISLEWSATELPNRAQISRARYIFGGTILAAVSGILPIETATILGAASMIAFGVINIRQAARAIDRRIFLLIGAALAMGTALEKTGGASFLGHGIVEWLANYGPAVVISALFLIVALLTNLLSNNATAVLFVPVAVSMGQQLGIDPLICVYTVIFAANCSFATPMGYQTNLLVMGPGRYQFGDYFRAGLPLIFIIWITFSVLALWYYDLYPS